MRILAILSLLFLFILPAKAEYHPTPIVAKDKKLQKWLNQNFELLSDYLNKINNDRNTEFKRSLHTEPARELVVKESTSSSNAWKITVESDGAISLNSTTDDIDKNYVPLSPHYNQAYFYKIDAESDGAFQTEKVTGQIIFQNVLIETSDGSKIYEIGVTQDGVIFADYWGGG